MPPFQFRKLAILIFVMEILLSTLNLCRGLASEGDDSWQSTVISQGYFRGCEQGSVKVWPEWDEPDFPCIRPEVGE